MQLEHKVIMKKKIKTLIEMYWGEACTKVQKLTYEYIHRTSLSDHNESDLLLYVSNGMNRKEQPATGELHKMIMAKRGSFKDEHISESVTLYFANMEDAEEPDRTDCMDTVLDVMDWESFEDERQEHVFMRAAKAEECNRRYRLRLIENRERDKVKRERDKARLFEILDTVLQLMHPNYVDGLLPMENPEQAFLNDFHALVARRGRIDWLTLSQKILVKLRLSSLLGRAF